MKIKKGDNQHPEKSCIIAFMDTNMLFSIGLNLSFPWKVVKSEFRLLDESNIRELHIWIDFEYGSRFISSKGTLLAGLTACGIAIYKNVQANHKWTASVEKARSVTDDRVKNAEGEIKTIDFYKNQFSLR